MKHAMENANVVNMEDKLEKSTSTFEKLVLKRDISLFTLAFASASRSDHVRNLIAKNVIKMPNMKGFVFNFTWGKTLRQGAVHMFGILCNCEIDELLCPVCRIQKYTDAA